MKIKYMSMGVLLLGLQVAASAVPPQAEVVVARYINALANGDTAGLRSVLGGNLLRKRQRLLGNPAYAQELRKTYAGTRHEILRTKVLAEDRLQLDVQLWYGKQESHITRLILVNEVVAPVTTPQYRIHARIDDVQGE